VQLTPTGAAGDAPPHHLRLGFLLARPWQGRGLMGRAVRTVIDHALAQPVVWRVDAVVDADNVASQRLLERAGMVREGRLARHTVHPALGMNPRDVWLYACWRGATDDR
jgi:RimJ/RimL family protein N-acetyltransferase